MKKLIAYALGISLLTAGTGYVVYKADQYYSNTELKIYGVPAKPTPTPLPTYMATLIVHNPDETIKIIKDENYEKEINPLTTPDIVQVYVTEDNVYYFHKKPEEIKTAIDSKEGVDYFYNQFEKVKVRKKIK